MTYNSNIKIVAISLCCLCENLSFLHHLRSVLLPLTENSGNYFHSTNIISRCEQMIYETKPQNQTRWGSLLLVSKVDRFPFSFELEQAVFVILPCYLLFQKVKYKTNYIFIIRKNWSFLIKYQKPKTKNTKFTFFEKYSKSYSYSKN